MPVLGGNPMIAPVFIPKAIEHIKQHIVLWYLNRMNGYVEKSLGGKPDTYAMLDDPKDLDRLFGAASQHVLMDTEQTLQGIMPVVQQMIQMAQQFKPKPPLTPDGQVVLQTSMAETQRRQARDQAEMQLKSQQMEMDTQLALKKQADEMALAMEELQLKMAIATNDQETKERIETARLTRDAARLSHDKEKTALDITYKGGPNGYQ